MQAQTHQNIASDQVINFTREKLKREIKQTAADLNQYTDQFQAIDIELSVRLQQLLNKMQGFKSNTKIKR